MLTQPKHSVLSFDGATFQWRPGSSGHRAAARARVLEEGLETLLYYWANELLPAPPLLQLARSNPMIPEQDLLAVDDLGRIHIFELKKDEATAQSLNQLVSYLAQRPRDDHRWLTRGLADSLWYGEQHLACYLAGLVSRARVSMVGTAASRRGARARERFDALLVELTRRAGERSGLDVSPAAFRRAAAGLLDRHFGGEWSGPLADPSGAMAEVVAARLPSYWRLGLARPGIVVWMIAPDVSDAIEAAQPFLERRMQVRCLSVDVREVLPGREWSIAVAAPENQVQLWEVADAFTRLAGQVLDLHLGQCPEAADRVYVDLPADLRPVETGIGWAAAGAAKIALSVLPDSVHAALNYHWWTEGRSLTVRDAVRRISRKVRSRHPSSWPWSPRELQADSNRRLVEGLAQMASDYWQSLRETGALDLDEWGYFQHGCQLSVASGSPQDPVGSEHNR